jgi:nucleoside-diphosphate-sugar epimerase
VRSRGSTWLYEAYQFLRKICHRKSQALNLSHLWWRYLQQQGKPSPGARWLCIILLAGLYRHILSIVIARDFSDVRFVAQAYVRLLHSPAAHGQAYNLCSGLAYTITEVLAMLTELTRHKIEVRVNPAFVRANEVKLLRGDRTRLDKTIGALPTIPFIESLQWMLE